jgi:hypothetical protein
LKQYKWKITVGAGTKQKCGHSQAAAAAPLLEPESLEQEFELEGREELSVEEQERTLILGKDEAPVDGGQIAHDEKAVKALREKAVAEMSTRGINISASENTHAFHQGAPHICDIDGTLTHMINSC